jgi:hypothetical protein
MRKMHTRSRTMPDGIAVSPEMHEKATIGRLFA